MNLGSFKLIHVVRLDASPALERIVDRITAPAGAFTAKMEEVMATARELLDSLRAGVEKTEEYRAEAERLRREKAEHAEQDRLRDEEEAEEDRLEAEEDEAERIEREEHAAAVARWEEERAAAQARITELERTIAEGTILSADERVELDGLINRLNQPGPEPLEPPAPAPADAE